MWTQLIYNPVSLDLLGVWNNVNILIDSTPQIVALIIISNEDAIITLFFKVSMGHFICDVTDIISFV